MRYFVWLSFQNNHYITLARVRGYNFKRVLGLCRILLVRHEESFLSCVWRNPNLKLGKTNIYVFITGINHSLVTLPVHLVCFLDFGNTKKMYLL